MKKLFVFILSIISGIVVGQDTPDPYKFTSLVDLYEFPSVGATGNISANIPLYTISTKGLEIPLTLNYDQMGNSNVFYIGNQFGDAWVSSTAGTISRECEDRPAPIVLDSGILFSSCGSSYTRITHRNYSLQNDEYYYSINPTATSRSKPDVYTFSFLGLSGKFIINKQGSQYVAQLTETSDYASISIDTSPSGNDNNFQSITITDKNGYKYKYASPTNINQNQANKMTFVEGPPLPDGCTIAPGTGETPYEGHELEGGGGSGTGLLSVQVIQGTSRFWENLELTEIYDNENNLLISYEYDTTGFSNPGGFQWVKGMPAMQSYQKLYVKKINIIGQGSINFSNNYATNTNNVVNSYTTGIEIKDLKGSLIKKVMFDYLVKNIENIKYLKDYFDNSYGLSFNKRLLSGIKEYSNNNQSYLQTTVEYKDSSIINTEVVVDRYGFLTKVGYCFPELHYSRNDYRADAFMLQKIKYPTGGSVVYEFEPNTFSHSLYNTNVEDHNYDNHLYEKLTLSNVTNGVSFNANEGEKIYILNKGFNSAYLYKKASGLLQYIMGISSTEDQKHLKENICKHLITNLVLPLSENNQYVINFSPSSIVNLADIEVYRFNYTNNYYNFRYAEGNRIAKVGYFKENVDKNILNTLMGDATAEKVIVFDYADQSEVNTSSGRVRTPPLRLDMLPFYVIYDQVTTSVKGIGKQFVKYDFPYNSTWPKNIRTDIQEAKTYDFLNRLISQSNYYYTYETPNFTPQEFIDKPIPSISYSREVSKNHENTDYIETSSETNYNSNNRQIASKIATDPLGKIVKTEFDYDVKGNKIVNTNLRNYVNNNLTAQIQNSYDWLGNPTEIKFKTPEMSAFEHMGNTNYHYHNGLLQGYTQLDGTPVTFVYGYNETQLVAKMINVNAVDYYASAGYGGIRSNIEIQSNQNHLGYNEAHLKSTLNSLRDTFQNALITTYIYKPMIGITSITDENGKETVYEYDTFNRLKTVKDYLGNIVKEYEYNFTN